jgi:hypothetical protein
MVISPNNSRPRCIEDAAGVSFGGTFWCADGQWGEPPSRKVFKNRKKLFTFSENVLQ